MLDLYFSLNYFQFPNTLVITTLSPLYFQSSDLLRYQILQSNVRYFYMNLFNLLNSFQFPQNAMVITQLSCLDFQKRSQQCFKSLINQDTLLYEL